MKNYRYTYSVRSVAAASAGWFRLASLALFMAAALLLTSVTAHADVMYGSPDWNVSFTEDKKMTSSFTSAEMDDVIYGLQPGDEAHITLMLRNQDHETTNWYMTNKVLYSLEDRSANKDTAGGAYTYRLAYTDGNGNEKVLFDSDTVGGEDISTAGEGLHEATDALEDYFYLDELKAGQSGRIDLTVVLDGETQGNDYQDTLADLEMNFAVELVTSDTAGAPGASGTPDTARRTAVVKTGDDTAMVPYFIAAGTAGAVLLILAFVMSAKRRKDRKKAVRAGNVFFGLFLAACLVTALAGNGDRAYAADTKDTKDYTYTVRIYAGAQGTIGGGAVLEYTDQAYGSEIRFNQNTVRLKDDSRYYIRGIRESGRDNNTVNGLSAIRVTQDADYVVAYGILGDSVAYTINYVDANGNTLAPSETYYGNVGDRPVLAYLYVDGYYPQAYNLTGTLSDNAAENNFTFIYQPVTAPGQNETAAGTAGTTAGAAGTGTTTDTAAAGTGAAGAATAGTAAGTGAGTAAGTGTGTANAAGTPADGTPAGDAAAGADEADLPASEADVPDIVDIDDGEVPLAEFDNGEEEPDAAEADSDPSARAGTISTPAKAGIGILAAVVAVLLILFFVRRNKKNNSGTNKGKEA